MKNGMTPIHPSEILIEEYISQMGVSNEVLAKALGLDIKALEDFLNNKTSVSADLAIRLSIAFSTTPEFWLNLEHAYQLALLNKEHSDLYKVASQCTKLV